MDVLKYECLKSQLYYHSYILLKLDKFQYFIHMRENEQKYTLEK